MDIASEQTIFRAVKDRDYSVIKNTPIRDRSLSWEARGVLAYLLTKPDDWEVRPADLINHGPARRDAMRRILKELRASGYMERVRIRQDDGTFKWYTNVYEIPRPVAENPPLDTHDSDAENNGSPVAGFPSPVEPSPVEPSPVEPSIYEGREVPTTDSPTTDSPTPERQIDGGGAALRAWLIDHGMGPAAAARHQHHDYEAAKAEFDSYVGITTGEERERRIGRLVRRWDERPPSLLHTPGPAQSYVAEEAPQYAQARALLPGGNPLELHYLYVLLEAGTEESAAVARVQASSRLDITTALAQLAQGGAL